MSHLWKPPETVIKKTLYTLRNTGELEIHKPSSPGAHHTSSRNRHQIYTINPRRAMWRISPGPQTDHGCLRTTRRPSFRDKKGERDLRSRAPCDEDAGKGTAKREVEEERGLQQRRGIQCQAHRRNTASNTNVGALRNQGPVGYRGLQVSRDLTRAGDVNQKST